VQITNKKSIEIFKKYLLLARTENKAFEPKNSEAYKDKTEVFASVCPTLCGGQDSVTDNFLLKISATPARRRRACAILILPR
jgi:hypothetical protein